MRDETRTKLCASCGRRFAWRAKWADDWDEVRFCSQACRRRKVSSLDEQLEERITALLQQRPGSSSICPSEVARAVDPDGWRELMEPTRRAARRLAAADVVEITQQGRTVDPYDFHGPIRIRRANA